MLIGLAVTQIPPYGPNGTKPHHVRSSGPEAIRRRLLWGDLPPDTDPKSFIEAVLQTVGFPC